MDPNQKDGGCVNDKPQSVGSERFRWGTPVFILGSVGLILGLLFAKFFLIDMVPTNATPVEVTVERGTSFVEIVDMLEAEGVIVYRWPLRYWAYIARADREIKSGRYKFSPGESPRSLLGSLVRGDTEGVLVTVPEGLRSYEIATILAVEAGIDSAGFMEAVKDTNLVRSLEITAPDLEGYLFPETYRIAWRANPVDVVRTMVFKFREVFDDSMKGRAEEIGLTTAEAVTLASIIEAESGMDHERMMISAVYHNRLRRGMRLEADPTVAFALGTRKPRLLYEDLEVDSPYNTYRYRGLPPGPIANPGRSSLVASLYPEPDSDQLFFVARGDGSHLFARTLEEHRRNIRLVRGGKGR